MRIRANRRKTALALTAVACLIGFAAARLANNSIPNEADNGSEPDPGMRHRQIVDAALARIAAESRGYVAQPAVEAAPRVGRSSAAAQAGLARPQPPDGYSFVGFHGEMPKARIAGTVSSVRQPVSDDLDWLKPPASVAALARQAAAAQRDWSFGWIRLAADSTSG